MDYLTGKKNFIARQWYYILQGLALVNDFKYLAGFILLIYGVLKLNNPPILVIIFLSCIPFLHFFGYIRAYYINKTVDYLTIELGTHWGRYTYELSEKQNKLLEEILKELKK